MNNITRQDYRDQEALTTDLCQIIVNQLSRAIDTKGFASFIISGGNSPKPLFEQLSQRIIDWQNVIITLADERWVDTNSSDSNEYLARTTLLTNHAERAKFIGLTTTDSSPEQGVTQVNERLKDFPLPSDICLLGMGNDGHTASLFPDDDNLSAALSMHQTSHCLAMTPHNAKYQRITLTLPYILNSKLIILLLIGTEKDTVLNQAISDGPVEKMPVRAILRQNLVPVHVFWCP